MIPTASVRRLIYCIYRNMTHGGCRRRHVQKCHVVKRLMLCNARGVGVKVDSLHDKCSCNTMAMYMMTGKVTLSLCLTKYYAMKMYEGVEI
jgi:hypothetical protein